MPSGMLVLMDDLAALLDDVAAVTQVAAKKTVGTVSKKLVIESRKVLGIEPNRPLEVLYKVFKGSLRNKAILVPTAFAVNTFTPFLIPPLLAAAGVYLCYEGAEKVKHSLIRDENHRRARHDFIETAHKDPKKSEEQKIRKAVSTDFILSTEIMILSLGKVSALTASLPEQFALLAGIGVATTGMIYGLVATILKAEEAGLRLIERTGDTRKDRALRAVGNNIIRVMPMVPKTFCVLGTAAMLGVGGNLLLHSFPGMDAFMTELRAGSGMLWLGGVSAAEFISMGTGIACGAAALLVTLPFKKIQRSAERFLDLRLGPKPTETAQKPAPLPQPDREEKPEISLKKEMQEAVSPPKATPPAPPKPPEPKPPALRLG